MAVTPDLISSISPYSVGTDGDITTDQFNKILSIAEAKVSKEKPADLPSDAEDYLTALLVCDLIERKQGRAGLKSESIGDYSYTRNVTSGSSYAMEYESEMALYSQDTIAKGGKRSDSVDSRMLSRYKIARGVLHRVDEGGL